MLGNVLARNARVFPGRVALVSDDETLTYSELAARAKRRAAFLAQSGIGRGDRVAFLGRRAALTVEMLFAAAEAGAALVPLNPLLVPREQRDILRDAQPAVVLFEPELRASVDAIRPALPGAMQWECVDAKPRADSVAGGAPETSAPVAAQAAEDDVALLVYTFGAAGLPKGAMLTHRNLIAAAMSAALELSLTRNDVCLSCAPLPLVAEPGRLLRFLLVGATIVLQPEFDPARALEAVERRRVTHMALSPPMIAAILDLPDAERYDLATLKLVIYGGAVTPPDLLKRAIGFFRCGMAQVYGQVEAAGLLTFLHPEDHTLDASAPYARALMSVGKEAIGVEIRVVDDAGRPVGPSRLGELVARGPNVFAGYHRDPALTAETLRDGWLYTGDVASVDEEGYIHVVDRKRDTFKIGGITVSPRELENVIAEHPAVREAAVIPRPDRLLGEVPVAVVALREGARADAAEILAHCRRNMAPFKVPASVEFLEALPRNSQGKVLKAKLRDRATGRVPHPAPPRTPPR